MPVVQIGGGVAALCERWGLDASTVSVTALSDGEPLMAHADLDTRDLIGDEQRRARAERERIDCTGTLRFDDRDPREPVWIVVCDECGYAFGVPAGAVDPQVLARKRVEQAGLPAAFAGRELWPTEGNRSAMQLIDSWLESPDLPAPGLWGKPGRGKSHLLVWTTERLLRAGHRAVYGSAKQLLDGVQREIGTTGNLWERLCDIPVLLLDDLGAQRETDWRRDQVDALIDHRYSRELPIVLASNFRPENWTEVFGTRAASRLRAMTVAVEVAGEDMRTKGAQEQ